MDTLDHVRSLVLRHGKEAAYALLLHFARSLLHSLDTLHKCGFVHNDIKPKNILYFPVDQSVRLIDLDGVTTMGSKCVMRNGGVLCTPTFAAPEVLSGASGTCSVLAHVCSVRVVNIPCARILCDECCIAGVLTAHPSMDMFSVGLVLAQVFDDTLEVCRSADRLCFAHGR